MNKSVFVGVITILLIVSIYSSSFTFDVSNAVPEYSEIECGPENESGFTHCCQETWDGEIIGSWLKTCTACDDESNCYTYNSNTLSPESTPPKTTAPKDNDAVGNVGVLEESPTPTPSPKNNDVIDQNDNGVVLKQNPSPSSSSSLSSSNSDNLGQVKDSTKQGNSFNDNSPTPPECPKDAPIPPNCTMKPKF